MKYIPTFIIKNNEIEGEIYSHKFECLLEVIFCEWELSYSNLVDVVAHGLREWSKYRHTVT